MERGSTSPPGRRVIILARGARAAAGEFPGLDQAGAVCVYVSSAYEAAAEMLAAPAVTLVIDLGLLTTRHLKLLEIARRMELEVLAVGTAAVGMSAEDLSGVRLVSREDLAEAAGRLIEANGAPVAAAPQAATEPPEPPQVQPAGETESEPSKPLPPKDVEPAEPDAGQYLPQQVEDLLTPEEISALLENEP